MSVNPSAHKSRYIQLSGFTQGKAPAEPGTHHDSSLCHFILLSFPVFALNFSLTSVREAIKMR